MLGMSRGVCGGLHDEEFLRRWLRSVGCGFATLG